MDKTKKPQIIIINKIAQIYIIICDKKLYICYAVGFSIGVDPTCCRPVVLHGSLVHIKEFIWSGIMIIIFFPQTCEIT